MDPNVVSPRSKRFANIFANRQGEKNEPSVGVTLQSTPTTSEVGRRITPAVPNATRKAGQNSQRQIPDHNFGTIAGSSQSNQHQNKRTIIPQPENGGNTNEQCEPLRRRRNSNSSKKKDEADQRPVAENKDSPNDQCEPMRRRRNSYNSSQNTGQGKWKRNNNTKQGSDNSSHAGNYGQSSGHRVRPFGNGGGSSSNASQSNRNTNQQHRRNDEHRA